MDTVIKPNWIDSDEESPPLDTRLYIRGYFGLKMWGKVLGRSIGTMKLHEHPQEYKWHVEGHDEPYWTGYLTVEQWAYIESPDEHDQQ